MRKRKPQVVWMPEAEGYLWHQCSSDTRKGAVSRWCEGNSLTWDEWRKMRPTLRVVKVRLAPLEAP